jgi:hypothetical protein
VASWAAAKAAAEAVEAVASVAASREGVGIARAARRCPRRETIARPSSGQIQLRVSV